jgi:fimbrial isopeptide formation D2 family protein/LPXTG-motif cell wall-anchored protein
MKKKILSLILAATLCFGASLTAFATESGTTGNATQQGTVDPFTAITHEYAGYQIFTGDYDAATKNFSNLKFGTAVTDTMKTELDSLLGITADSDDGKHATQIAKALNAADMATLEAVAVIINTHKTGEATKAADLTGNGYYLIVDVTDLSKYTNEIEKYGVYLDRPQLQVVVNGQFTAEQKRDKVTVEKKVKDINDSVEVKYSEWQDSADYDLGDTIDFKLTGTLPADYAYYDKYEYVFSDVQSAGLDFQADSVKVYLNDETDDTNLIDNTNKVYTVTKDANNHSFEVKFDDLKKVTKDPTAKVIVTYQSVLTGEGVVFGATGNPNKVRIEFDNKTGGKGKTPWDTVIVFTFKAEVDKVDGAKKPLKNAQFTIEKLAATEDNGKYTVVKETKDGKEVDKVIKSFTVNVGGEGEAEGTVFSAAGLDDGVYKITETVTPAGYNTIDPIYFVIAAEHDENATEPKLTKLYVTDLNGKVISKNATDLGEFEFVVTPATGNVETTVVNEQGVVLPSTGGIGTTIFYVVGGVLVAAAVVLLVVRRRMRTEEE